MAVSPETLITSMPLASAPEMPSTPSPAADKEEPPLVMTASPIASASAPAVEENMEVEAASVQTNYMDKLAALQEACANKAGNIVKELAAEVQAGQKEKNSFSVSDLQSKFLPKIEAAEQDCDVQFHSLITSAEQEYQEKGIPLQDIEGWKAQYETAKRDAQKQAVETILSSLSR